MGCVSAGGHLYEKLWKAPSPRVKPLSIFVSFLCSGNVALLRCISDSVQPPLSLAPPSVYCQKTD